MPRIKLCQEEDLAVGEQKIFTAGNQKVLLFHLEDGFYATGHRCTHVARSLEKGTLMNGCEIRCPLHHARFDVRTGAVVEWANRPKAIKILDGIRGEKALPTFETSVEGGSVFVETP